MTATGLIAVAVVLVFGTGIGLWRRRVAGRLRSVPAAAGSSADGRGGIGGRDRGAG